MGMSFKKRCRSGVSLVAALVSVAIVSIIILAISSIFSTLMKEIKAADEKYELVEFKYYLLNVLPKACTCFVRGQVFETTDGFELDIPELRTVCNSTDPNTLVAKPGENLLVTDQGIEVERIFLSDIDSIGIPHEWRGTLNVHLNQSTLSRSRRPIQATIQFRSDPALTSGTSRTIVGCEQTESMASAMTRLTSVTSTGSGSWTVPEGVNRIKLKMYGGGGGGGRSRCGSDYRSGAGGGGGGTHVVAYVDVVFGDVVNYQVGRGGSPGSDGEATRAIINYVGGGSRTVQTGYGQPGINGSATGAGGPAASGGSTSLGGLSGVIYGGASGTGGHWTNNPATAASAKGGLGGAADARWGAGRSAAVPAWGMGGKGGDCNGNGSSGENDGHRGNDGAIQIYY